jgi:hypothetical protein
LGSPAGPSELEEVVDCADHGPLASDLIEAPQQELAKASGLLHLPEHRLDLPGWSIVPDWNRWVAVKRLAADCDRPAFLARAYRAGRIKPRNRADIVAEGENDRFPM